MLFYAVQAVYLGCLGLFSLFIPAVWVVYHCSVCLFRLSYRRHSAAVAVFGGSVISVIVVRRSLSTHGHGTHTTATKGPEAGHSPRAALAPAPAVLATHHAVVAPLEHGSSREYGVVHVVAAAHVH